MKTVAIAFIASAAFCPCAQAQEANAATRGLPGQIEKGSLGSMGARVSVFFAKTPRFATGFEVGYSRLAGVESEFRMGPEDQSVLQWERADRKLWHATFTLRRNWGLGPRGSGLYAGGGTGLYYLSTKSEFWEQGAVGSRSDPRFRKASDNSLHVGANIGGGWSLQPLRGAGAVDFDVRLHMLPFAGGEGVRSVLTFSVGLSFF